MPKRKQKVEPWQLREERKREKYKMRLRKRYLICTEGKTEALYFDNYKSSTGPIVVVIDCAVPVGVIVMANQPFFILNDKRQSINKIP